MDICRKFGLQLYKLRNERNLTQNQLASKAGISVKYLQNLESKRPKTPSLVTLKKLADALQIELWKLLKF